MNDYLITYIVDGTVAKDIWFADTIDEAKMLFSRVHPYLTILSVELLS